MPRMPTRTTPRWPGLRGLTRFEFALSVAVIGVLLALALPRLQAPWAAARHVRLQALLNTTRNTAALFHGHCEVQAANPANAESPCARLPFSGQTVAGMHGWPAASADGIATALKLWGDTADIDWQPERIDGVPALRARLKPTTVAGTCEFIYAQAASPGAAPRIELIDASCP
jgi:hypothetical protein